MGCEARHRFTMESKIIILSAAVFLVAQAFSIDPFKIDKRWERFKKAYNKTYPSDSEESKRHAIWKNNTMLIMEHNKLFHANKTTFRLGMNSHADMTATEFAARYNGIHGGSALQGHWQAGLPVRADPGGLQRPRGQHGVRWRADGPGFQLHGDQQGD